MGYFRIFYYITYILNFILRIIKRHGKAVLWFICIAIFLVICLYNPKSQAVYIGNEITDTYSTVYDYYDSICLNFIRRIDNYKNSPGFNVSNYNMLVDKIKNQDYYFYVCIDENDDYGLTMINGSPLNYNYIRCVFLPPNNNRCTLSQSVYENYCGLNDNIYNFRFDDSVSNNRFIVNATGYVFTFQYLVGGNIFYIPNSLLHYRSKIIDNYFINNYSLQEIEILYEMEEKLSSVDDTLQQQQEYLEQEPSSEDFNTDDLPTDSGITATTDSGLNSFFNSLYVSFIAEPNSVQHNIQVPIPFTR